MKSQLFFPMSSKTKILTVLFFICFSMQNIGQTLKLAKGLSSHEIQLKEIKMHYVKAGNGPKLMIVIHGFPEFWYGHNNILQAYVNSKEYTVVAPDMRGYNLTDKPAQVSDYVASKLVGDVIQLGEALGHKKFILGGHDWGGIIAWWTAITNPECVSKLIIINAPHPAVFAREMKTNPEQLKANNYTDILRSELGEEKVSANDFQMITDMMMGEGFKTGVFTSKDKDIYREAWSRPGAITGGLNWYRASRSVGSGFDIKDFTVKMPTLVIWGMTDAYILPGNLDGLDSFVPNLTVKRVSDASHWIIHEKPKVVMNYIKDFLK